MIGEAHWYTGMTLIPRGEGKWALRLEFLDSGFCDLKSTEGVLRLRYLVERKDLVQAARVLLEDAEKLGLRGRDPTVYIQGDGAWPSLDYPSDWRELARDLAHRLGWRKIYELAH